MGLDLAVSLFSVNLAVLCMMAWRFSRRLAGHASVPLNFNLRGVPDRHGPRWLAVAIMPALYALIGGVSLLASAIPQLEPATAFEARSGIVAIGPIFILLYLGIILLTLRVLSRKP